MTTPPPGSAAPTSAEAVAAHLKKESGDTATRDQLEPYVRAANVLVRRHRVPRIIDGAAVWPDDVTLGATMLAARLWRRRNSPEGVATFGADGALYVSRTDPDIAQLLQLGQYAPPVVG